MTDDLITEDEYARMEHVLACLMMNAADYEEEVMIVAIHARVATLYERGAALRASRERLKAIRESDAQ